MNRPAPQGGSFRDLGHFQLFLFAPALRRVQRTRSVGDRPPKAASPLRSPRPLREGDVSRGERRVRRGFSDAVRVGRRPVGVQSRGDCPHVGDAGYGAEWFRTVIFALWGR